MLSFTPMGRCGNYMMELFTAWTYARKHGLEFSAPSITTSDYHCPIYCRHLINPNYNYAIPTVRVEEKQHGFEELPFHESWRNLNILLVGYFQSEKFFLEYRDELLEAVGYPWRLNEGVVSVHNRRGDYLVLRDKHPYYGEEWIEEAMKFFPGKKFLFFSDEIKWAKEKFGNREDCMFSEGKSIEEDLVAMSCCEHHINSSSTYSWIGAWMNRNPNKKIITPKLWFTEGWGNLNVSDIIPESWIKL